MMRAAGKIVVVLGASSEGGTGWRTAERFAAEGAKVVVAARSLEGIERLAKSIDGFAVQCDAGDEAAVERLAAAAFDRFGTIDVAVNAAGLPVPSTIWDLDAATLLTSTNINYFGHLFFYKHMVRKMKAGSSITSIASLSATAAIPGNVIYGCAKAAVVSAMRYAAVEFADKGIRVNAISPGIINTPMAESLTTNPAVLRVFMAETPLKRIAQPEEVADAALWLMEAVSTTGVSIIIDGGMHLRRPPYPDEMPQDAYDKLV